jgi:hypothetical protein
MTSPLDLDALQKLAEAATPGPWECPQFRDHPQLFIYKSGGMRRQVARALSEQTSDAAFIAAANPQTVLALIAAARRLARLESALEFLAGDSDLFDLWREDDGFHAETPHGFHGVTASSITEALLHHSQRRGWRFPEGGSDASET